ncbi:MAG: hypothetical protein KGM96_05075 [Acidobacteriota bacterium]|nr:hypothetical protein [Acidobacteriota bacterium]
MKKISPVLLGLSLAVAGSSMSAAQQASTSVPKVIQLTREFVKPGKAGMTHDKSESAFVNAMAEAKSPTHYTAMCSLSGKSRCLYFTPYSSFDAWQKDTEAVAKNKDLSAKLDQAMAADGDLLDSVDQAVLVYDEDMSYHAPGPRPQARFMEITEFHVRAGHTKDFADLAKMYIAACEKAGTSAHWAMFHLEYGGSGGTYLLLSSDKSMAEIDSGFAEGKKIRAAMGEEGMKKFEELDAATVESANSQLFAINPRQSYVSDDWIKTDPDFWKPAQ